MSKFTAYYHKYTVDVEKILAEKRLSLVDFQLDFKKVRLFKADGLEQAYVAMQGENWSPNGEMRPLIERLGVDHTSAYVGDIFYSEDTDSYYMVDHFGFSRIEIEDTLS